MSIDKKISILLLTHITILFVLMNLSDKNITSYVFLIFMGIFPLVNSEFKIVKLILVWLIPLFIFTLLFSIIHIGINIFYIYALLTFSIFIIFYSKYIRDKVIFLLKAMLVLSIPVLVFILISQYLQNPSDVLDYIVNFNGLFRTYLRFFVNPETSYIYFTIVLVILTVIRHRYTVYLYILLVVSEMIYLGILSQLI